MLNRKHTSTYILETSQQEAQLQPQLSEDESLFTKFSIFNIRDFRILIYLKKIPIRSA